MLWVNKAPSFHGWLEEGTCLDYIEFKKPHEYFRLLNWMFLLCDLIWTPANHDECFLSYSVSLCLWPHRRHEITNIGTGLYLLIYLVVKTRKQTKPWCVSPLLPAPSWQMVVGTVLNCDLKATGVMKLLSGRCDRLILHKSLSFVTAGIWPMNLLIIEWLL